MNKFIKFSLLCFALITASNSHSYAQKWIAIDDDFGRSDFTRDIIPDEYLTYSINLNSIRASLEKSPNRFKNNGKDDIIISVPLSDGTFERYSITRSDVFHPDLAKKYPQIQSYTGLSLENPGNILKLSISHKGINGMILSDSRPTEYIDPYARQMNDTYIVYNKNNFHKHLHDHEGGCTVEHPDEHFSQEIDEAQKYGDCQLRKYRLAMACTGEYATFHGGNIPDVLAEYNASLTRVNGIYEKEFAITMELIANTDELIYLDGATDPYTNNSGGTMLTENQNNIDEVIGFDNYDIGHVYSTGGGGIASLRSPCTTRKARGVTGLGNPSGDPFWVDYVAHEIGHQFGGNHTFNNSCNNNVNESTAFEPGSGATIMAYAGICSPNIQNNSDDYFHSISVQEVANFVVAGNGGCAETIVIDNTPPEIISIEGNNYILPISTPFELTAVADDADEDPLTYCWEQRDNEMADMPPESSSTDGPSFRSYSPTSNPTRYFPRMSSVLFGSNGNTWEVLPSVSRSMNFNVIVRDNNALGGCTANDELNLTFSDSAGPFEVTSQNTNESWSAGNTEKITWDVANTDQEPINCGEVDIYLSTDAGENFDILVLENTPNDGEEEIDVPFVFSDQCRLKVICSSSIFFDVNSTEFAIEAPFSATVEPALQFVCKSDPVIYDINVSTFSDNVQLDFDVEGLPDNVSANFSPESTTEDGAVTMQISSLEDAIPGEYELVVSIISDGLTLTQTVNLIISAESQNEIIYLLPENAAINVNSFSNLSWEEDPSVLQYEIELSKSPSFDIIEYTQITNTSVVTGAPLQAQTVYYWRVRPLSSCYTSNWDATQSFQTGGLLCISQPGEPNVTIPETISEVTSISTIDSEDIVSGAEVSLLINHSYVGDLTVELEAPDGDVITLFERPGIPNSQFGCSNDNLDLIFSDGAPQTAEDLETTCESGDFAIQGEFMPVQALSGLNGKSMNGDWKLIITDSFGDDGGELVEWNMTTCSVVDSEAALLINNEVLILQNELSKNITQELLNIEHINPINAMYTLRSTPSNGHIQRINTSTGETEQLEIGSQFSQEDINENRIQYAIINATDNLDQFTFDVLDDGNRYLANQTFNINTSFTVLTVSTQILQEILCFGDANGEISAQASGGLAPLSYSIDGINYSETNVFSDLTAGTYTISVRDATGTEIMSDIINLVEPELIEINIDISINSLSISPQGGTEPYQFSLDGINYSETNVFDLEDGTTYSIYVKDANDCEAISDEFTHYFISDATTSINHVDCAGANNGEITILSVDGGLSPYIYTLNQNSNATGVFSNLSPMDYEMEIIDAQGNTLSISFSITEPTELSLSTMVIQDSIYVDVDGGVEPYTYSLDGINYTNEPILIGQVGEAYTVYVLDANGCIITVEGIEIISSVYSPELNALQMYPNPATNSIQFGSVDQLSFDYKILDMNGRLITDGKAHSNQKIDVSQLPQGMFLVKIDMNDSSKAYRLIVIK